jgi:hypothetical protein
MASTIKVDNVQNTPGTNIVNKCGTTVTVGAASDGIRSAGNNLQASDGGNLISQSGTDITLGASGDTINLASGASQSGFGRTGTVDWITTPKVTGDSPVTGVSGKGYFMNTTAGAITLNLPAGTAGDIISVADYAATFATYLLTITPNGSEKIGGLNGEVGLGTDGQAATFVYVDSTQGWVNTSESTGDLRASTYILASGGSESTCGDYKTHIFTGPGTFSVTSAGSAANDEAQYLVVAGGGAGAAYQGTNQGLGGGGAGGFRVYDGCSPATPPLNAPGALTVTAGSFSIAVGAGGAAGDADPTPVGGTAGSASTYSSISSAGGGATLICGPHGNGGDGGSGGGGGRGNSTTGTGGASAPVTSPAQGQAGGGGTPMPCQGPPAPSPSRNGGGGGGAGAAGGCAVGNPPNVSGAGGIGSYICGTNFIGPSAPLYGTPGPVGPGRYFSGGGGGAGGGGTQGAGGAGGGTAGVQGSSATDATVNTGGGGGGANNAPNPGGAAGGGGSGLVVIKYKYQ